MATIANLRVHEETHRCPVDLMNFPVAKTVGL